MIMIIEILLAFGKDLTDRIRTNNSFIVASLFLLKPKKTETLELILKDSACSNIIKRKICFKRWLIVLFISRMRLFYWNHRLDRYVYKSFKHKDTVFTKPIFEDKIPTLLKT